MPVAAKVNHRDDAVPDEMLAVSARQRLEDFRALYERYTQRIERYVLGRISSYEDAEDVVSVVFTQALRGIGSYDATRGTFAAWLFGIARNAVAAHYRQRRGQHAGVLSEPADLRAPGPETAVLQAEDQARVLSAIRTLTVDQQDALALRYLGELSFAETARELGRSEAATKMLVRRALESLRRQLISEVDQ